MAPLLARLGIGRSGFGFGKKSGGAPPTFAVSPSTSSVNEGSSVTFTVTTSNVSDGTTLYWSLNTVSGTINSSDFTGAAVTGSFSISSNTGSVALTLANDTTTEGSESFQLQVRTGSTSGTIVATSSTVTIGDTSTNPILADSVVNPYLELALPYGSTYINTNGLGSYRYWRYQTGANLSHFPRASRLILRNTSNSDTTITTFTGDNCSDGGTIPGDGTAYDYDFGSATNIKDTAIYSVYADSDRTASSFLYGSTNNSTWTLLGSGRTSNTPLGGSVSCGVIYSNMTYFTDYSNIIKGSGESKKAKISGQGSTVSTAQSKYYGRSLSLDGSNYVDITGTLFSQSSWTFEAWLYKNSSSGMDLLNIGGNNCSWYFANNSISCDGNGIGRVNYSSGTGITIPTSTWFHFVQVNNNGSYKVYIDGVGYNASSTGSGIPSGTVSLGNSRSDNNTKWNGYIQDLRLYDGIVKYTANFTVPSSMFAS